MADTVGSLLITQNDRARQYAIYEKGGGSGHQDESKYVDLVLHVFGDGAAPDAKEKQVELAPSDLRTVQLLILICGIGTSMAWYSVSGAVAFWSLHYDETIYGTFLFAYNAPAFFLLVAQSALDDKYDGKYGSGTAYTFRTGLAYLVLGSCCLGLMLLDHGPGDGTANKAPLLILVGIIGVFDSVGYGSLSQMASKLNPRVSTYMFVGQSVTSFLLLGYTLALNFGAEASQTLLTDYLLFPIVWIIIGLVCFAMIMKNSGVQSRLAFVDAQSARAGDTTEDNPLNATEVGRAKSKDRAVSSESKGVDADDEAAVKAAEQEHLEPTAMNALKASWPMQVSTFLIMMSILCVQTFYGAVPSQNGAAGTRQLGTVLVYSKFAGEFLGKQLCAFRPPTGYAFINSPLRLLLASSFMPLHVIAFSLYTSGSFGFWNDVLIVIASTVFALYEAYYLSISYVLTASSHVPEQLRGQATSILNLVLMVGILFGNQILARIVKPLAFPDA